MGSLFLQWHFLPPALVLFALMFSIDYSNKHIYK